MTKVMNANLEFIWQETELKAFKEILNKFDNIDYMLAYDTENNICKGTLNIIYVEK